MSGTISEDASGTVWEGAENLDHVPPLEVIERLFVAPSKTDQVTTGAVAGQSAKRAARVCLVEVKKAQALAITLSRFKMSPEDVGKVSRSPPSVPFPLVGGCLLLTD